MSEQGGQLTGKEFEPAVPANPNAAWAVFWADPSVPLQADRTVKPADMNNPWDVFWARADDDDLVPAAERELFDTMKCRLEKQRRDARKRRKQAQRDQRLRGFVDPETFARLQGGSR